MGGGHEEEATTSITRSIPKGGGLPRLEQREYRWRGRGFGMGMDQLGLELGLGLGGVGFQDMGFQA